MIDVKNLKKSFGNNVVLKDVNEHIYPGEIKDLILSTLNDGLSNIETKTRRYDVVQDIIQANDYKCITRNIINL